MPQISSIGLTPTTLDQYLPLPRSQQVNQINQKRQMRRQNWIRKACWTISRMNRCGTRIWTMTQMKCYSIIELQSNRKGRSQKIMMVTISSESNRLNYKRRKQKSNPSMSVLSEIWARDSALQWSLRSSLYSQLQTHLNHDLLYLVKQRLDSGKK